METPEVVVLTILIFRGLDDQLLFSLISDDGVLILGTEDQAYVERESHNLFEFLVVEGKDVILQIKDLENDVTLQIKRCAWMLFLEDDK